MEDGRPMKRCMTRRTMVAIGGALPVGALVAACGGSGDASSQKPAASAKPAKVVLRTLTTAYQVQVLEQKLLPGYRQKVPQHNVEWERGGEGVQMIEAVMAGSAAGTAPDVFWIGSDFVAQLARAKVIREITG